MYLYFFILKKFLTIEGREKGDRKEVNKQEAGDTR